MRCSCLIFALICCNILSANILKNRSKGLLEKTINYFIELVDISDIKAISVQGMDYLRGQMKRLDIDFMDGASMWYYYDAMNPIQAYEYSTNNPSKLKPYITFCDSMQQIYRDCLIEYIQKGELSKVIDK